VAAAQLNEVRLPLHILLDNRFGELNENQEELLGAARAAADVADANLAILRQIAELELGTRVLRRDRIYPADMLHAILPVLQSVGEAHEVLLHADIAPLVPALHGDAAQLQRALLALLRECVAAAPPNTEAHLSLAVSDGVARVALDLPVAGTSIERELAQRVIAASGGETRSTSHSLTIILWK
jgi:K+-sensing histidine kinase KdpD